MNVKDSLDPESLLKSLSETIRYRRKKLKISQEDLSSQAGFARGYLSDIERGARSFSIKNLARLSNVLKITPSALLCMTEKRLRTGAIEADTRIDSVVVNALIGSGETILILVDAVKADFPIIFVSHHFEQAFGYSRDEVLGRNFSFLLRGELYQEGLKEICQAVEVKSSCVTRLKCYRKDGTEIMSDVSASSIVDENGEVIFIACLHKVSSAAE
ncbi:MAG: PAS domain-containing protein [Candidatus Obscuribacter sp.]|jgi:PAS domain S-box-containing protein|nr:PAS domain-containing protein [Candidatus Obscuribacter sp.]MBK7840383.1 PAS domain-containing protein [Candidatus Obscuribacter sp.]MBK9201576.1 PAS domain-containing protein [Candidatus Obscuribacter sp.]MBK9619878.1 PAS domain-containing protein [Candidatus Obscuribacter sp.]MBK9770670.1 PAS domain-containing protein [Candidatus Obscuribacter sp.]